MSSTKLRIGWVGLGKMGAPMARNLLAAGYPLAVFNRTPAKTRELVEEGALAASSVTELARGSDVVFSMVADDASLQEISIGAGGLLEGMAAGAIYIDMSTVSPAASQKVSECAAQHDIHYLRAPVSGSTALAAGKGLTVLVSGPRDAFEDCRELFAQIGRTTYYLGAAEQARFLKLSINMMVGITAAMMGEALALGQKGGVDWREMIEIINNSAVASPLIGYKAQSMKERDFTPMFSAAQMAKDFDLALETARIARVPLPVASLVRQYIAAMISSGNGELDFFAYVALFEELAALQQPVATS